jgi:hypothetical protein
MGGRDAGYSRPVGLRDLLRGWRRREDAAALERAEAMAVETPEERAESSGDIEGMVADEEAARAAGEPSIEDAERLGEEK